MKIFTWYSHQLAIGVSFGLTAAVIYNFGIIGLFSAAASKTIILAAIIIMSISDGLADAVSLHITEESETEKGEAKHTLKEVWLIAVIAFLSVLFPL